MAPGMALNGSIMDTFSFIIFLDTFSFIHFLVFGFIFWRVGGREVFVVNFKINCFLIDKFLASLNLSQTIFQSWIHPGIFWP